MMPVNKASDLTEVSTAVKATTVSSCLPDNKSEARILRAALEVRKEENTEKGKV